MGGAAEEEGAEGVEYRRPQRLRLLAALARRRLTPPPAAGLADSEDERGTRS